MIYHSFVCNKGAKLDERRKWQEGATCAIRETVPEKQQRERRAGEWKGIVLLCMLV